MWTIHKFPIPPDRSFVLELPERFRPLALQVQREQVCLWVMLDDAAPRVRQRFEVRGTGHVCDGLERTMHVGTLQVGAFVFHVFHVDSFWCEGARCEHCAGAHQSADCPHVAATRYVPKA